MGRRLRLSLAVTAAIRCVSSNSRHRHRHRNLTYCVPESSRRSPIRLIMAGFLKSIYDWLLRMFWLVFPSCLVDFAIVAAVSQDDDSAPPWPDHLAIIVLIWLFRATEMDVTMIGLQNAGKTSLLRVLAVCFCSLLVSVSRCDANSTMR